jgi:Ca2+-binding EF-hand superfamily protein
MGGAADSFHQFDDGGKGWLSRSELKFALASMLGYKPSKVSVLRGNR